MNDKELADKVVALGVGGYMDNRTGDGKEYYEMRRFEHGTWTFDYMLETAEFVRDPRVSMALMEKCVGKPDWMPIQIDRKVRSEITHRCWIERTHSGTETETYHARDESLPRAINEACVEALT